MKLLAPPRGLPHLTGGVSPTRVPCRGVHPQENESDYTTGWI